MTSPSQGAMASMCDVFSMGGGFLSCYGFHVQWLSCAVASTCWGLLEGVLCVLLYGISAVFFCAALLEGDWVGGRFASLVRFARFSHFISFCHSRSGELSDLDSDVHSMHSLKSCAGSWEEEAHFTRPAETTTYWASLATMVSAISRHQDT